MVTKQVTLRIENTNNCLMTNAQEIFTAIIAAILGIAFPILIQSISRIDEKYGSTRLMKRFKNEFRYHFFISTLIITLLLLVYYIFAPPRVIDIPLINSAIEQSAAFFVVVSLIILVIALFSLIFLILDYYDPEKLHQLLSEEVLKIDEGNNYDFSFGSNQTKTRRHKRESA